MPTYNQLCKKKRIKKKKLNKTPALEKCPQKKGICTKISFKNTKKTKFSFKKTCKIKTYK